METLNGLLTFAGELAPYIRNLMTPSEAGREFGYAIRDWWEGNESRELRQLWARAAEAVLAGAGNAHDDDYFLNEFMRMRNDRGFQGPSPFFGH